MSINISIFSDYVYPYCYIGKGIIDHLKNKYDIRETWISYEILPETPPEGILLAKRFKSFDIPKMYDIIRRDGKEFGITFGEVTTLSNSRLALEASEYARDMGRHEQFHANIFDAYFTKTLDIGNLDVISDVASRSGLDVNDMINALQESRYKSRMNEAIQEGKRFKIKTVPTFIIDDEFDIVGYRPIEVFEDLFHKIIPG